MTLLHRLALESLPVAVADGKDVDTVRLLALAGHVRAEIPRPVRTLEGHHQPPATVLAITPLGREMLLRFPRPAPGGRDPVPKAHWALRAMGRVRHDPPASPRDDAAR